KVAVGIAATLLLSTTTALAGPTMRFGLTGAIEDQGAPGKYVFGPAVALGLRGGPFVGELEWAYLSFFDPDTTDGGIHRLGLSLRADVYRSYATRCIFRGGCTRAQSLWVEAGAGERFGRWHLDAFHMAPASDHQPEAHVSVGIELDNQIQPMRNGFQLGLRVAIAPRGYDPLSDCRTAGGSSCAAAADHGNHGGIDSSVLLEWMFLFGN
ncbi:MAG: hypothetical protein ABI678_23605, partial [Kofleriaceae bacterium]